MLNLAFHFSCRFVLIKCFSSRQCTANGRLQTSNARFGPSHLDLMLVHSCPDLSSPDQALQFHDFTLLGVPPLFALLTLSSNEVPSCLGLQARRKSLHIESILDDLSCPFAPYSRLQIDKKVFSVPESIHLVS